MLAHVYLQASSFPVTDLVGGYKSPLTSCSAPLKTSMQDLYCRGHTWMITVDEHKSFEISIDKKLISLLFPFQDLINLIRLNYMYNL